MKPKFVLLPILVLVLWGCKKSKKDDPETHSNSTTENLYFKGKLDSDSVICIVGNDGFIQGVSYSQIGDIGSETINYGAYISSDTKTNYVKIEFASMTSSDHPTKEMMLDSVTVGNKIFASHPYNDFALKDSIEVIYVDDSGNHWTTRGISQTSSSFTITKVKAVDAIFSTINIVGNFDCTIGYNGNTKNLKGSYCFGL